MPTTTPIKQKGAAVKAAVKKSTAKKPAAKPAADKKPARDRSRWEGLTKGTKVKLLDGRTGVAAYFHTHYARDKATGRDDKTKPIGMVGVLLDP
jgi:hypothetical protein